MTTPQVIPGHAAPARIVIDTDQLDGGIVAELVAVAARAGAEVLPWRALQTSQPLLVVGALGRGERTIPTPLLDAVNTAGAALLLVSHDPLIRPVVTSHGGRVTMVAASASRPRVRGTLRMLLASYGKFASDQLDGRHWSALWGDAGALGAALHRDRGGAVTGVFPLAAGWSGAAALAVEAHRIVASHLRRDDEEQHVALRELFGSAAGMVQLSADASEWTVYWPSSSCPLVLCSVQRLPEECDLATHADTRVLRLAASPGDAMVALSSTAALARCAPSASAGGAAFLDELEATAASLSPPPTALIVEVR